LAIRQSANAAPGRPYPINRSHFILLLVLAIKPLCLEENDYE